MTRNPLERWLDSRTPRVRPPMPLLLAATLDDACKTGTTECVDWLVDHADTHAPVARHELALAAISVLVAGDPVADGDSAADRFLEAASGRSPSERAMSLVLHDYIRAGPQAAAMRLRGQHPDLAAGVARILLVAVLIEAGWPADRAAELWERYCSAVDVPFPGQEPAD
ncbi:hypothetical protein [Prauserella cavernicola]|uniref:Uncharacterized protein n=1 Tax=Prauserella cavernicola TaxID=2800127 RepID=A0A934QN28_9PSEU|nr:hypothetical protein [Prauserella cavernicola]MBK1783636.1 hypothetical protein [Prauserella cavernicola]